MLSKDFTRSTKRAQVGWLWCLLVARADRRVYSPSRHSTPLSFVILMCWIGFSGVLSSIPDMALYPSGVTPDSRGTFFTFGFRDLRLDFFHPWSACEVNYHRSFLFDLVEYQLAVCPHILLKCCWRMLAFFSSASPLLPSGCFICIMVVGLRWWPVKLASIVLVASHDINIHVIVNNLTGCEYTYLVERCWRFLVCLLVTSVGLAHRHHCCWFATMTGETG